MDHIISMRNLLLVGLAGDGKSSVCDIILKQGLCTENYLENPKSDDVKKSNDEFNIVEFHMDDELKDIEGRLKKAEEALEMFTLKDPHTQGQSIETSSEGLHQGECKKPRPDTDAIVAENVESKDNTTKVDEKTGFDALIFVTKYGLKFTKQNCESIKIVETIFGKDIFKNWGIIVITFGDNFESEGNMTFKDFVDKMTGDFKQLIEDANNRYILMNKNEDMTKQVEELKDKINELKQGRYSKQIFEKNKCEKIKEQLQEQILTLEQECYKSVIQIHKKLKNNDNCNSVLTQVKKQAKGVQDFLDKASKYKEEKTWKLNSPIWDTIKITIKELNKSQGKENEFIDALIDLKRKWNTFRNTHKLDVDEKTDNKESKCNCM